METPKNKPWNFCETPEEKCTMNYCDENGCQSRKRNLVEPKKSKAATFILGQIDKSIEKSNLEQQIEKLEAEKKELLETLEKVKRLEPIICMGGAVAEQWQNEAQALNEMMAEIESLIQKHKQ